MSELSELLQQRAELVCPLTGEVFPVSDVDTAAEVLRRLDGEIDGLIAAKREIEEAMVSRSPVDKKTSRLIGKRFSIKIERPSEKFNGSVLRQLWKEHAESPERDRMLRVVSVDVNRTELKKCRNASPHDELQLLVDKIEAASMGESGRPRVTIEVRA